MSSSCHNSPTKVVGDITKHYVCESCGQACDEVSPSGDAEVAILNMVSDYLTKTSIPPLKVSDASAYAGAVFFPGSLIRIHEESSDEWYLDKVYMKDHTISEIIAEANRRRDQEWREKLEDMKGANDSFMPPPLTHMWNSALDEAKKLFTREETRK